MNEKHTVERDIALTFDFLRYLVDHPKMIDQIPENAEIEFTGSDIVTTEKNRVTEQKKTQRDSL